MNSNPQNPLVSICIPVLNGGSLIWRALESALNQTYNNIEIIVADNKSDDDTPEIVLKYASRDKRVKYFRYENRVRFIESFFRSFENASGDFVQHLAHDDWLSRNYIEECIKNLRLYPETGGVYTRHLCFLLKEGSDLEFEQEVSFVSKNYPVSFFFNNVYCSLWGGLSVYALLRKKDVMRASKLVLKMPPHPSYGNLYEKGATTDWMTAVTILKEYRYLTFTNKTAYIKINHIRNVGKELDINFMKPKDIWRYHHYLLDCLGYVYIGDLKRYMPGIKRFLGVEAVATLIVNWIKSGFRRQTLREWRKDLGLLSNHYSFFGFLGSCINVPLRLIIRLVEFSSRKPGPVRQTVDFAGNKNYFISRKLKFEA